VCDSFCVSQRYLHCFLVQISLAQHSIYQTHDLVFFSVIFVDRLQSKDKTLTNKDPIKTGRVIVETDTYCSHIMSTKCIQESKKVKEFLKVLVGEKTIFDLPSINVHPKTN